MSGPWENGERECAEETTEELVCIVDDEEPVRTSLSRLFRSAGMVSRTFASAGDFLRQPPHAGPCCLMLDMKMPGLDGLDLQRMLHHRSEGIVFLTGHGDVPMCARAMKEGAVDFLTKPVDDGTLLETAGRALARSRELVRARSGASDARSRVAALTQREEQVMRLVVQGLLNKQIGAELGIAEKTVKIHRGRVMSKTGCLSVPDLVRLVETASDPHPATTFHS